MNETSFHSSFPSSPSPSLPTFLLQIQSYNLGSLNKYIYIYISLKKDHGSALRRKKVTSSPVRDESDYDRTKWA